MKEKKILIVDDEVSICSLYTEAFAKKGYTVTSANSAEDALDILKNESFQVMFLDLNLPGMNGVDLCKETRLSGSTAKIYAVTGYSSRYGVEECKKAGFDEIFTKPVKLEVLFKAARDAFKKTGGSARGR